MFRVGRRKGGAKRDANLVEPEDVTAVYDINYAGNADRYNLLDVYYPKDTEGLLPVIVSIHGGGYVYGTKEIYKFYGMYIAEQGFTFVNFNYHLAPEEKFPTQLTETNMVLEWMTEACQRVSHGFKQCLFGWRFCRSADGKPYAAIASKADYAKLFPFRVPEEIKIRAIGLNCGMYILSILDKDGKVNKMNRDLYGDYLGKDFDFSNEIIDVLGHITGHYPPTYVMTSYHDFLKENAQPMYEFLKGKGIPCAWKCYGQRIKNIWHMSAMSI